MMKKILMILIFLALIGCTKELPEEVVVPESTDIPSILNCEDYVDELPGVDEVIVYVYDAETEENLKDYSVYINDIFIDPMSIEGFAFQDYEGGKLFKFCAREKWAYGMEIKKEGYADKFKIIDTHGEVGREMDIYLNKKKEE